MKKLYSAFFVLLTAVSGSYAQQPARFSQYFQNAFTINPAITGVEGFLDLKMGYRQQWTGLDSSPQTLYLSAHAPLTSRPSEFAYRNSSLRISNPSAYDQLEAPGAVSAQRTVRHGIGGYLYYDQVDLFQQTSLFASYAAHIRVSPRAQLAVGLSAGINNGRINTDGLTTANPDRTLDQFLNQSDGNASLDLNLGLFFYSDRYYVGYSADRILRNSIVVSTDSVNEQQAIYHYGLFGLRFDLGESLMLLPGAFVGASSTLPLTYDLNLRLRYEDLAWVGVSYRNSGTLAGMLGLNIDNRFSVNYSYDYGVGTAVDFRSGTHEIVLGFILFNQQESAPYLW